jgi:GH35 family endo-1,4-beta-xylanase
MMLNINGKEATYSSPSTFGCPDNNWGRGLINLPIDSLKLTNVQKELTQFTLTVGSRTGAGNYYIDNLVMEWATGNTKPTVIPEQVIEKTPEEKKEILTNALESWIKGTMEACNGYVKAWDVVNEPMDDANPSGLKTDPNPKTNPKEPVIDTNFYWQDYLGKDYARTAVKFARQYGGSGLKLFVNDYGLESNPAKCDGLIKMIQYWESDGVTKIDGIGTQMHVTCSLNPDTQKSNENKVTDMFNALKATGKLIRISALDMKLTDANGSAINMANATFEQQTTMSKYYNFIVSKYIEIIPAAQRYGITLWNSVQSSTNIGLWNSSYNRIYTYTGFADALK